MENMKARNLGEIDPAGKVCFSLNDVLALFALAQKQAARLSPRSCGLEHTFKTMLQMVSERAVTEAERVVVHESIDLDAIDYGINVPLPSFCEELVYHVNVNQVDPSMAEKRETEEETQRQDLTVADRIGLMDEACEEGLDTGKAWEGLFQDKTRLSPVAIKYGTELGLPPVGPVITYRVSVAQIGKMFMTHPEEKGDGFISTESGS